MAPNIRVAKAFRAMREIGIMEEKVKPVLKNLLKLYDKNWELIEVENYRALADAIFEKEESQATEQKKKNERADVRDTEEKAQANEEPVVPPLKRLRRNQESQASASVANPSSIPNGTIALLKKPKEEVVELPEEDEEDMGELLSCPPLVRKKGKQPLLLSGPPSDAAADTTLALPSPITRRREKGKEPVGLSVCLKAPKVEPGVNHLPKQQLPVPLAMIHPEPLEAENSSQPSDSFKKPDCSEPLISHPGQNGATSDGMLFSPKEKTTNCETSTMLDESMSKWGTIPSSTREEKQRNGSLDALDVSDKAIGPDNRSFNSENVNKMAHTQLPTDSPSSGINNCNKTSNGTVNHIAQIGEKNELNDPEDANSHDLVVQLQPPTPNVDIANGQEKVVISYINEINDESPPSFRYIPQNVVFQNAYVNFSLARIGENCCMDCVGDCLSSPTPCSCAHESGGEYAYTSEGLVKEDILKESVSMNRDPENHCQFYCSDCPLEKSENNNGVVEKCQGHLMRRFIKECWWKCGCDIKCGNRVVQRGITRKLQVFMTPEGKGWGLRTLEDLPEGAFVCEYVGEILTNAELFERVSNKSSDEVHSYPVLLDADWGAEGVLKDEEALCLDATHYGNVARFVNHRCVDSNMVEIPVEVETPDHHYYHLAFFTTRKVNALEELTWDYGINFDDKRHPVKAFKCRCGSKLCRNLKRYNRSKSKSRYGRRR